MMTLSPLEESWKIQADAAAVGFDWPDIHGVVAKIAEELDEVRQAINDGDLAHARLELGDILLATVNLARFLEMDPGEALRRANARFSDRFEKLNILLNGEGRKIESCTLDELNSFWELVKRQARQQVKKGS